MQHNSYTCQHTAGRDNPSFFPTILPDRNRFEWKSSLVWLTMPLFLLGIILIIGLIASTIEYYAIENWPTKMLQTFFDFPAILFFSVSTVFIEELFFRSFLIRAFRFHNSITKSIFFTAFFWAFFCLSDTILLSSTLQILLIDSLYYFTTGVLLGILTVKYGQIFYGYFYRVGILSFNAILLSYAIDDQNTLFVTKSVIFGGQGILYSIGSFILAYIVYLLYRRDIRISDDF